MQMQFDLVAFATSSGTPLDALLAASPSVTLAADDLPRATETLRRALRRFTTDHEQFVTALRLSASLLLTQLITAPPGMCGLCSPISEQYDLYLDRLTEGIRLGVRARKART